MSIPSAHIQRALLLGECQLTPRAIMAALRHRVRRTGYAAGQTREDMALELSTLDDSVLKDADRVELHEASIGGRARVALMVYAAALGHKLTEHDREIAEPGDETAERIDPIQASMAQFFTRTFIGSEPGKLMKETQLYEEEYLEMTPEQQEAALGELVRMFPHLSIVRNGEEEVA